MSSKTDFTAFQFYTGSIFYCVQHQLSFRFFSPSSFFFSNYGFNVGFFSFSFWMKLKLNYKMISAAAAIKVSENLFLQFFLNKKKTRGIF